MLAEVNAAVKRVRPGLQVGFHIEHVNSFNPIFRATRSYADLATKADFLKVVVYNNCGGERYANFIRNVGSTVFRDVPQEELLRFNNHLLNYGDEAELDELAAAGLSADYVFRETQRALAGVQGKCKVLPGIDIGIPTGKNSRKASPEDTYAAVPPPSRPERTGSFSRASIPNAKLAARECDGRGRAGRPRRTEKLIRHDSPTLLESRAVSAGAVVVVGQMPWPPAPRRRGFRCDAADPKLGGQAHALGAAHARGG